MLFSFSIIEKLKGGVQLKWSLTSIRLGTDNFAHPFYTTSGVPKMFQISLNYSFTECNCMFYGKLYIYPEK